MNKFFERLYEKSLETDQAIAEIYDRAAYACSVLEDVYDECNTKFQETQDIITSLLEEGDFESAMKKIAEVRNLTSLTSDEAIKNRLSEYNLKKTN